MTHPTTYKRPLTVAVALHALLWTLAWTGTASALPCLEDKFGGDVNCTANDISITDVTDIDVTDDGCTSPDDTVTFNATLTVVTTATARYDVGVFIGEGGVQAQTGECSVYALPTSPTPPFSNLDADACGDSESSTTIQVPITNVVVECQDVNGDNELDLAHCTSWQQNKGDVCDGPEDVTPGTSSKCNCPITPTDIPIFVPDPVCITNADCEELATGCNVGICDVANPDAGAFGCTFTPTDSLCDDGLFCNGEETCDDDGECVDGSAPDCDDEIACTTDACNEADDECTHTPVDSACDDDLFCNGDESCDAESGCQAGTPPNCADAHACTTDSCNEATDSCVHTPDDDVCDDDLHCNGDETCSAESGCQAGTPPNCADAHACTTDSCNETTDSCDHVENDDLCDDDLYCNGDETCSAESGCQAGTPPNCADAHACTTDSCNEATDSCDHVEDDDVCDDDLHCNGDETCSAESGCQAGTPPNCADAHACTIDSCNETTDSCDHVASDDVCDDDLVCNGTERCDVEDGCVDGTAMACDDGIACTLDACSEVEQGCITTGDNNACDDQNDCTADLCDPTNGCEHEGLCESGICRSPGFWSTHGGFERNGSVNVTQAVLDAVGGIEVCGETITSTSNISSPYLDGLGLDSALEGLCVSTEGVPQRALYRQLIAAALNCAISGSTNCDETVGTHTDVSFDECNALCAGEDVGDDGPTIGDCIGDLDCYNNGGEITEGECALGTCSVTGELCGADAGACPLVNDVPQGCDEFPGNCHDAEFCQEAIDVCPERLGPASSSKACREAKRNDCTIDECD
jgi:hypothetical protein